MSIKESSFKIMAVISTAQATKSSLQMTI